MLREIINYVESIEFDVEVGLSSSVKMFRNLLIATPKVQQLTELCKDRSVAIFILGHMLDLATRKFDPRYRNPLETAMTTYLHCIVTARPDLTKSAMSCAHMMKGTFWVGRYIQEFLIAE